MTTCRRKRISTCARPIRICISTRARRIRMRISTRARPIRICISTYRRVHARRGHVVAARAVRSRRPQPRPHFKRRARGGARVPTRARKLAYAFPHTGNAYGHARAATPPYPRAHIFQCGLEVALARIRESISTCARRIRVYTEARIRERISAFARGGIRMCIRPLARNATHIGVRPLTRRGRLPRRRIQAGAAQGTAAARETPHSPGPPLRARARGAFGYAYDHTRACTLTRAKLGYGLDTATYANAYRPARASARICIWPHTRLHVDACARAH